MASNVIQLCPRVGRAACVFDRTSVQSTVVKFPNAKERKVVAKIKASQLFAAAETIAAMAPKAPRPVEMMLELSTDPNAGIYREKAATWLWLNVRVKVTDDEGRPMSKIFQRTARR